MAPCHVFRSYYSFIGQGVVAELVAGGACCHLPRRVLGVGKCHASVRTRAAVAVRRTRYQRAIRIVDSIQIRVRQNTIDTGSVEDCETGSSHELTVRPSDGSLYADTTVTVNITDASEVPDDFNAGTDTTGTVDFTDSDVNVTGKIETAGDADWFAVTLEAARTTSST